MEGPYLRAERIFNGLLSLILQIAVTEIVVHKAGQPDTVVDFFAARRLTRARSARINSLANNTNSSAAVTGAV